ncbi:helix-turn-helix domain-containing protein [Faecalimonas sp.]
MLDSFLETNIQHKLKIINTMYLQNTISNNELCSTLNLSLSRVDIIIDELNNDFENIFKISKGKNYYSLALDTHCNLKSLIHLIYKSSSMLHCLKFLITNDKNIPFSKFIDENFLTKSSAYRIRQKCDLYLHSIGLSTKGTHIMGEEYRIRFLIALLYCKYGFNCCEIDETSLSLADNYITSTNQAIDIDFLRQTYSVYDYFKILLILAWKRKSYSVNIPSNKTFSELKNFFIYEKIKLSLKSEIEPKLHIAFSENDFEYIYLAYCTTSNCVFNDIWSYDNFFQMRNIIFSDTAFYDLVKTFHEKFGEIITQSPALLSTLIAFYKTFLFELHCIIPDNDFYDDRKKDQIDLTLFNLLKPLLDTWKSKNQIKYDINKKHLFCLSLKVKSILQQFMKPISIFIVSGLVVDLENIRLYLERNFSNKRITILPLLFSIEHKDFLKDRKNCIIIVQKHFETVINSLDLDKSNTIIPITIEMNDNDIKHIQQTIAKHEESIFYDFIYANKDFSNINYVASPENEVEYRTIQKLLMR